MGSALQKRPECCKIITIVSEKSLGVRHKYSVPIKSDGVFKVHQSGLCLIQVSPSESKRFVEQSRQREREE